MIFVVRHGRTEANASGLLLGRADPALDETGRAQAAAVAAVLSGVTRVVDAELAAVVADRDAIANEIPEDMLATYERLRKQLGGVAVARLEGNQCKGCHVSLPAMEVDAIRHAGPDDVITHEECGRILVRA